MCAASAKISPPCFVSDIKAQLVLRHDPGNNVPLSLLNLALLCDPQERSLETACIHLANELVPLGFGHGLLSPHEAERTNLRSGRAARKQNGQQWGEPGREGFLAHTKGYQPAAA